MSPRDLISNLCALRPRSALTTRARRGVQRKIDELLAPAALAARPEPERWAIACACQYARGEIGARFAPEEAARELARSGPFRWPLLGA